MLDITPINQEGKAAERRCAVCSAAPHPLMTTFVTHNDEATHKLLAVLDETCKAHQDDHLYVVIVLPGQGDEIDSLRAWSRDQHFATPAAVVALDDEDLGPWQLRPTVENTVVSSRPGTGRRGGQLEARLFVTNTGAPVPPPRRTGAAGVTQRRNGSDGEQWPRPRPCDKSLA